MSHISNTYSLGGLPPDKWNAFINYFNHQAKIYANDVYIHYYTEESGKPEYLSLTYGEIDHITINLACEWYKDAKNKKAIAVLFDHSIDLLITMLAIFKLRIPLLVLSPRNSKAAISNLLQKTECTLLVSSGKYKQIGENAIGDVEGCRLLSISGYNLKYLAQQPLNNMALSILDNSFDEKDLNKVAMIIHSSGTTGFPKPVYQANRGLLARFQLPQDMIESRKPNGSEKDVLFAGSPMFHSFGFSAFFSVLYNGSSAVFPKRLPPSQQDIDFGLKVNKCSIMSIPPITLGEMVEFAKDNSTSSIRGLRCIMTGGAQITNYVGNWFYGNGIQICIVYGLSEAPGTMTNDWDITKGFTDDLHPHLLDSGGKPFCQFETYDDSNPTIKHLCVRSDLPTLANNKLREDGFFETGDLFEESLTNPGRYQYVGRKDDTIIMSNGEKTNPVPMEQILNKCPLVKLAIVFGRGRQCTSVLVLPESNATKKMNEKEVMKHIGKYIKEANDVSPSHSAIVPQMVKILPSDTILPLTPKGTFMRKKVEEIFEDQLDKLYDDFLENKQRPTKRQKMSSSEWEKQNIVQFLLQGAANVLDLHADQIQIDQSLFDLGLNSLKSIELRNYISTQFDVDNNFIFHHSSILSMHDGIMAKNENLTERSYNETQNISKRYLAKSETDFKLNNNTAVDRSKIPKVVLLTGATGSLGAFILCQLLKDSSVKKVYCVIRGDSSKLWLRLEKSFLDRSLDISLLSNNKRVETISLDFMDENFGLDKAHFMKLKKEVNMVQHCGWLLDFNMPIEHFDRECIAPFYNLLKFSLTRIDPIPVHFISSTSASANLNPIQIQEAPLPLNSRVASPMGYAQSKFVVEILLEFLFTKKNLPCYIHRVGQMHGDTKNGVWNYSEQFPLMFIGGGLLMGKMPVLDRVINWIPVDYAAKIIVEIMSEIYAGNTSNHIFHIVNPRLLQWTEVLDILKISGINFTTVSLAEWVNLLKKSPKNPAVALISHYEAMIKNDNRTPSWETEMTKRIAPTMKNIPPLDTDLFRKFLVHWNLAKY